MIIKLYYCDICKKRIRKKQKVWLGSSHEYHFECKFKEQFKDMEDVVDKKAYKPRKLEEFL